MTKHFSMLHIFTILMASVVLQLGIGAPSFAGGRDAKDYPATVCMPEGDPSGLMYSEGYVSSRNPSPRRAGRVLNCPIMRDSMSNDDGIETVKIYVEKLGETGKQSWSWCRLRVAKPDTSTVGYTVYYSAYDKRSTTDSKGRTWFEFKPKKKFPSGAFYSVSCRIPIRTVITSISVTEKGY